MAADDVDKLKQQVSNLTAAASSAAATTVTALERLQEAQRIVDAAVAWRDSYETPGNTHQFITRCQTLRALVDEYRARVKARS